MKFKKWNIGAPAERDVERLRAAGYPYLLSTVLAARGVVTAEDAAEALERERSLSLSPMLMRDMGKAVEAVKEGLDAIGEFFANLGKKVGDALSSALSAAMSFGLETQCSKGEV